MGARSSAGNPTETKSYENPEPGVYPARCIQVVELGTHTRTNKFGTKDKKEILIIWELSELMEDGRPFVVNWKGTNSLQDRARLYKMLVSWRGKPFTAEELADFDMGNILDKCCLINVTKTENKETGREYRNVDSVMPLPKGMACIERVNELVNFGITDVLKDEFEKLYPWVQKIVLESHEVTGKITEPELPLSDEEEVPF